MHPYKRLQHLAGRLLLPTLFDDFPLADILIADTRKPYLVNEQYHFSISHCGNLAAAIVSSSNRVGVDIERITPRIKTISHKFLHEEEAVFLNQWNQLQAMELELVTILWAAKESIYKWYGLGLVDFKNHMRLDGKVNMNATEWLNLPFLFKKNIPVLLAVRVKKINDMVLAWVLS